jgi:hypothetical protein
LIWRLEISCSDPNVLGNKKKEKELIKQFDQFYELLKKSFKNTVSYQMGLIKVDREIKKSD